LLAPASQAGASDNIAGVRLTALAQ